MNDAYRIIEDMTLLLDARADATVNVGINTESVAENLRTALRMLKEQDKQMSAVRSPYPPKQHCTLCGAHKGAHTDFRDGIPGHEIRMPGERAHGQWHAYTDAPLRDLLGPLSTGNCICGEPLYAHLDMLDGVRGIRHTVTTFHPFEVKR